jgi:hypothetical protein
VLVLLASFFCTYAGASFGLRRPAHGRILTETASALRADYSADPRAALQPPLLPAVVQDAASDSASLTTPAAGGAGDSGAPASGDGTAPRVPLATGTPADTATPEPSATPTPRPAPTDTPQPATDTASRHGDADAEGQQPEADRYADAFGRCSHADAHQQARPVRDEHPERPTDRYLDAVPPRRAATDLPVKRGMSRNGCAVIAARTLARADPIHSVVEPARRALISERGL